MCECKCERKLRTISNNQIEALVVRAESAIYSGGSNNRTSNKLTIENVIRQALQTVDAQLAPACN